MKKNFYLLAMLLVGSLTMFSACGDDDDKGGDDGTKEDVKTATLDATAYDKWVYFNLKDGAIQTQEIEPVAGSYSGSLNIKVGASDMGTVENQKFEITRTTENKDSVVMVIKDFTFGQYGNMGDVTGSALITLEEAGYKLTGAEMPNAPAYRITSCEGLVKSDQTISLTITLQMGSMPMAINVTYDGTIENALPDETTIEWDFAMHRDDIKTNGGSALKTTETDMASVTAIPTGGYIADFDSTVIYSTKNMVTYGPNVAASKLNASLYDWITRKETGTMPPYTYELPKNIFILKCKDGSYAKIQFTDFSDDSGNKWHNSFSYVYPFK